MISLFFPYYQCGDSNRQKEIDFCLETNAANQHIQKLFVVIDDDCICPIVSSNIKVINCHCRLTYKKWIELTSEYCIEGISLLCNSDIYFDESVTAITDVLSQNKSFMTLSRWEQSKGILSRHPNPHWSQDAWAVKTGENFTDHFLWQLDFPMGIPRCDNKIAYLFAIQGWKIFNPMDYVKGIHVHETQMRTYNKKMDDRILGGMAYVHPGTERNAESLLDVDVWTKRSTNVNNVSINKSMEKWAREARDKGQQKTNNVFPEASVLSLDVYCSLLKTELEIVDVGTLLHATRQPSVIYECGPNFQVLVADNRVIFKNNYNLSNILTLSRDVFYRNKQASIVAGLIPPVLNSHTSQIGIEPESADDLNFWQYPCSTEKQAFENHLSISYGGNVDVDKCEVNIYVPVPWATYVDKWAVPERYLKRLKVLISFYRSIATDNGFTLKVHSVCQHIRWTRALKNAQDIGITDFHISHKDSTSGKKQQEIGTHLNIHGWTLLAVNYEISERREGMDRKPMEERKLLASFIGAHMKHYRDDSRVKLFEAAKAYGRNDVLVDLGSEWHFEKIVYDVQVLNKKIESRSLDEHTRRTIRYNSILSDSKFSFCPIGAGPNTLRLWESIAVGAIPVLFSDDLSILLDNKLGREILENSVLLDIEDHSQYFSQLEKQDDLQRRSDRLIHIYNQMKELICYG